MDTSVHKPPCYALFDPVASECASCAVQAECINEQKQQVMNHQPAPVQADNEAKEPANPPPVRKEKQSRNAAALSGDEQYIPEHTRKPLEIPSPGTRLQAAYKGKTYEALVVEDPSNPRFANRSVLFNGTVYKTLTAAAHAIAPGINSGSVWQII